MPTLIRMLAVVGLIAGLAFGALWSLANLIEPEPREITITIPADKLGK